MTGGWDGICDIIFFTVISLSLRLRKVEEMEWRGIMDHSFVRSVRVYMWKNIHFV